MKTKLYDIYYSLLEDPTLLDLLTYYVYKLNDTKLFKNKFINLIYKLEKKKFGIHEEKLIEELPIDYNIESINQYNHANKLYRTKAYEIYHLELMNGYTLDCADEHLIYVSKEGIESWMHVSDLTTDYYVLTDCAWVQIKSIKNTHLMQYMCDITVEEDDHSYFSNGILSHNTTTTAAYFTWYLCFHYDKTTMVVANKGRTGKEILSKIREVIEDLPYFMKPGIVNLSETKIKFENGCSLSTAAASKSPATGDSINLLYIDEAALIPSNIIEEYWASVYPTLSSFRGSLIILSSTPRGKGNLFYRFYDGALNKTMKGWISSRVDWWEVKEHDEEWYNLQLLDLGEDLFRREVELSFESAGARLISAHSVKFFDRIKLKFIHRDFYSVPDEVSSKIIWSPDFDPTRLSYNDLKARKFLLVVDTALGSLAGTENRKESDYNVINIFEIEPLSPNKVNKNRNNKPITIKDCIQYKQVGVYMDNYNDEAWCAEAAKYITFLILKSGYQDIDNVRILLEINFNGNNWITKFKMHPSFYENLIIKTVRGVLKPGVPIQKMKLLYGYRTSGGEHGKSYYCELGASMMHNRLILIRLYADNDINKSSLGELNQFGKNEKGNYQGLSCHDDLAITCLFVCIALESREFNIWLNDWIENTYQTPKIQILRLMLNIYVEQEAQMSDEMFHAFYSAASAGFGKLTHKLNGYGSIMNGDISGANYYNNGYNSSHNGYNSGFGKILPRRY